ncbi:MAG: hypothetical protein R3A45_13145 [Bdellovibrionota bacterium]
MALMESFIFASHLSSNGYRTRTNKGETMHILDQTVSKRHLLQHPFLSTLDGGTLTNLNFNAMSRTTIHVEAFPRYVSAVHAQLAKIKNIRKALLDI